MLRMAYSGLNELLFAIQSTRSIKLTIMVLRSYDKRSVCNQCSDWPCRQGRIGTFSNWSMVRKTHISFLIDLEQCNC